MFYIVNSAGEVVASVNRPVNSADLASRGERILKSELNLALEDVEVVGFPEHSRIRERTFVRTTPRILLTTTAEDMDGDGLPELPADGESRAEITASLERSPGQPAREPIEVHFRTSAGALSRRSVISQDGKATIQLTASRETVMATVVARTKSWEPATLSFEFVPKT